MLDQVDRSGGPEACWPWKASVDKSGYGEVRIDHGTYFAHRIALKVLGGVDIHDEQVVRHKCDNPICCNPAHLSAGSQADNVRDMIDRGRQQDYLSVAVGSSHAQAKIDEAIALAIFQTTGFSHRKIAKRFGVSCDIVRRIKIGTTWNHVTMLPRKKKSSMIPRYVPTSMTAE